MHQPWSQLLYGKCKEISGLRMGKVRELRSAALVELNSTLCSKMFTENWNVAFRDSHRELREVVTKGLPSLQSEERGPRGGFLCTVYRVVGGGVFSR